MTDSSLNLPCGHPQKRDCLLTRLTGQHDTSVSEDCCVFCGRTTEKIDQELNVIAGYLRIAHQNSSTLKQDESGSLVFPLPDGTLPALKEPEKLPSMIGSYEVLGILGRGGMGVVYRVRDAVSQQELALKTLAPSFAQSRRANARFQREMATIQKLQHPGIVPVINCGDSNDQLYFVMPVIDGVNVGSILYPNDPWPLPDVAELIRQMAEALAYAHERMVIHRDIKPSNLMLSRTASGLAEVKLLDLGVAITLGQSADTTLTEYGQILGTLDFMAPEQLADSHNVDHRADIYSLGVTTYRLLSGSSLFDGEQYNTPYRRAMAIRNTAPMPIGTRLPQLPRSLATFVDRMLEKEPTYRPRSMAEIAIVFADFNSGHRLADRLPDAPPH